MPIGKHFKLDSIPEEAYFYNNDCKKIYICRSKEEYFIGEMMYTFVIVNMIK